MGGIKKAYFFLLCMLAPMVLLAQESNRDSLLKELGFAKDDTNKVNLLRNIGVTYANEDPGIAIEYWKKGVMLSYKLGYIKGLARNYINIGTGYSFLSKIDSTIIYADSGIKYSKIIGDPDRLALVYLNKADGYRNLGNFRDALLYCDTASMYAARTGNTDRLARIYDIISGVYSEQKQFLAALDIQKKALALYIKDKNEIMEGQVYDDFGILYQLMGKPDSAMHYFKRAISIGERLEDNKNLSTYYYSMAQFQAEQGNYKEAEVHAAKSLRYGQEQENNNQLAMVYNLLGDISLKQKKYAEAVRTGTIAYEYAANEIQMAPRQNAAALLAEAFSGKGDAGNAYRYLKISSNLKDSIAKQQYDEQVANLQSSFELKEKDKEILLLEKNRELQQQKLQKQRILIVASAGLAVLALAGIWMIRNRSKLKQQMKELELRTRIAADLHDEVGSSLSSIHMLSQMASQQGDAVVHKDILSRMSSNAKETMDKMGDIVWMIKPGETEAGSLKQRMERFAYEISGSKNITLQVALDELENVKLTMEQRKNIWLIFKEAVNNAVKYSGTERMEIMVVLQHKELILRVKDFGNGFDAGVIKKGNGLDNMRQRAADLKADLLVDSVAGEGAMISLRLPM
ncbi:MAG: tetratricopeptide repeat protein [Chitinophagales bacterium]|nr:tetratricopeptide repeat protein [Chitinophagales bacterium]